MTRKTMQERLKSLDLERQADTQSDQKLAELIIYVSSCCEEDIHCGATKLNKILYFSDAMSFARFGEPITGAQYIKEAYGPIPLHFVPVREKLKASGAIAVQKRPFAKYEQTRIVPLREPQLDLFRPRDIVIVNRVINILSHYDARSVSDLTHAKKPWQLARAREVIPYSAILLSNKGVTEDDVREAQDLIKRYGWKDV